ncbi:MAG: hypothetical protein ACC656_13780, partial [Candidatus Heimdallarchaeota archaeon]
MGTVDGKLYVYEYDSQQGRLKLLWDSFSWDLFNLGTNIWDIVPVSNKGKLPTWLGNQAGNTTLDISSSVVGDYNSHTQARLLTFDLVSDYYAKGQDDLVVTNSTGYTFLFGKSKPTYSKTWTEFMFENVNNYYSGSGMQISHSFVDVNGDGFTEIMVTGSWDKQVVNMTADIYTNAGLDLWLASPLGKFIGPIQLDKVEVTGLLSRALARSYAQPSVTFSDLDDDGDLDIIFNNGKVFVLWNIFSYLTWRFDSTYFEEINNNQRNRFYVTPVAVDFDEDNVTDLVFSYSQTGMKRVRYGATYWQNLGTQTEPKWQENKWLFNNPIPDSNLAYNNYTNMQFMYNPDTGRVINMTAYSKNLNAIVGF